VPPFGDPTLRPEYHFRGLGLRVGLSLPINESVTGRRLCSDTRVVSTGLGSPDTGDSDEREAQEMSDPAGNPTLRTIEGGTVAITGAGRGLGLALATQLAHGGARVILACRDQAHGDELARGFRDLGLEVEARELDLASRSSIASFVGEFDRSGDSLDLLVNNAAVMYAPYSLTADGYESHWAVNYLGHFELTRGLLTSLNRSDHARVVNVTSVLHRAGAIAWDDLNFARRPYDRLSAYAQSKVALTAFSAELNRRSQLGVGVAVAADPGMVATTGLTRHMGQDEFVELVQWFESAGITPTLTDEATAVATILWAATNSLDARDDGIYVRDCEITDEHAPDVFDASLGERLWAISEQMLAT
jgi:NAD(P)-dependent dehydrogenase (short-subunit alcohol dehydrogenase family)